MKFLIAYDVADPKRLRRVAECLERAAQRTQKSVFLLEGSPAELAAVQRQLIKLIDWAEDRIQSWPVIESTALSRWDAGQTLPSRVLCAVVTPREVLLLEDRLVSAEAAELAWADPRTSRR